MNLMDSKVGLPYFVDLGVNLTDLGMHFVDLRMCFEDLGMDSKTGSVELRMDFVDGAIAAQGLLKRTYSVLNNPKHMVATQGDLVFADAFIRGDFSFVDKNNGLLNLFMIFVNNRDLKASVTRSSWWTTMLFTAAVSSTKYFIRHVSNQSTLTQARKNISHHYDLSEEEDLKVAQERKISLLIEKPSDEASRPISPMDARRSRDYNDLNDIL
ncbi:hypothetical protein CQW23_15078 [Capsicum baccatum]|uniref:Uncharacterized protein n=1 Tax=Capsicum baccatum TaxID=33114 RepID=A0A2G2WL79_CAPBA|nr:hypothetical protein CQW23_15078 [Capsicum baccatum]